MTSQLLSQQNLFDLAEGRLSGPDVSTYTKSIGQLKGVFADEQALSRLPQDLEAYSVQIHAPVPESTPGGLFCGVTCLHPGMVGEEYLMTRGHSHREPFPGEYYLGLSGQGVLLLMDSDGVTSARQVAPGCLYYIPGYLAHRLVNTGDTDLRVASCWPADTVQDYESVETEGFSLRVLRRSNTPTLVEVS